MQVAELTGAVDGTDAQRRRRCDLSWSGSSSEALRSFETCARGERSGEVAWLTGGRQQSGRGQNARGRSSFIAAHCMGATQPTQRESRR
jgi:hypothetical protein